MIDEGASGGSLAHSWHSNIAMACFDSMGDGSIDEITVANEAASRFMKNAFDIGTIVRCEAMIKDEDLTTEDKINNKDCIQLFLISFVPILAMCVVIGITWAVLVHDSKMFNGNYKDKG